MSYAEDWHQLVSKQPDFVELVASSVASKVPKSDLLAITEAHAQVLALQKELREVLNEHKELAAQVASLDPDEVPQPPRPMARRESQLEDLLSGLIAVSGADFSQAADLQMIMSDLQHTE